MDEATCKSFASASVDPEIKIGPLKAVLKGQTEITIALGMRIRLFIVGAVIPPAPQAIVP